MAFIRHIRRVRFAVVQNAGGPPSDAVFVSGEEGDVTNAIVVVVFSEDIFSPTGDYLTGVTIKVNGVAEPPISATRQTDHAVVHYELFLTDEADANDTITFEYSDILGDIESVGDGGQLDDVFSQPITNNVGTHLRFTDAPDGINAIIYLHL